MTDRWMDRLSEYLDGELAAAERAALEAHLLTCDACRETLAELRGVVRRAHALVDRPVPGDLWAGVAARIRTSGSPVVSLPAWQGRRKLALTIPQLAAAAVVLLAVGAGATALALRPSATPAQAPGVAIAAPAMRALPAGLPTRAEESYDAAVRDLQRALDAGQSRLSPKTVAVLERNLARIDQAIADARHALEADPANVYLSDHLASTMRQKLQLLQQAAVLANSAS